MKIRLIFSELLNGADLNFYHEIKSPATLANTFECISLSRSDIRMVHSHVGTWYVRQHCAKRRMRIRSGFTEIRLLPQVAAGTYSRHRLKRFAKATCVI